MHDAKADGLNGDTMGEVPFEFFQKAMAKGIAVCEKKEGKKIF